MSGIEIKKTGSWEEDAYTYETYAVLADGIEAGGAQVMVSKAGAYCERIDIEDGQRGKGYGTALLRELSSIYGGITAAPENEGCHRLMQRVGTEVTSKGDNWSVDQGFGVYEI